MFSKTISLNENKNKHKTTMIRLGILTALLMLFLLSTQSLMHASAQVDEADLAIRNPDFPGKNETLDPVKPGQSFLYKVRLINDGPDNATNVILKDWVPAGLSINNATPSTGQVNMGVPGDPERPLIWAVGLLEEGEFHLLTYNVTVLENPDPLMESWILHNDVFVSSDTYDPDTSDNYYTEDTTVITTRGEANIGIFFPGDRPGKNETVDPVSPGQTFLYKVYVTNAGPDNTTNVVLKDWVPAGLRINNATASDGHVNIGVPGDPQRPLIWVIDTLRYGETNTLTYNVTVLEPDDPTLETWVIHNDVMVTSDKPDPEMADNYHTEDTTVISDSFLSDLRVLKMSKPDDIVKAGTLFNYTIIVENRGPSTARNVRFRDEIRSSGVFTVTDIQTISGSTYSYSITPPETGKTVTINGIRNDSTMNWGERDIIQVTVEANETQDINNLIYVYCNDLKNWVDPDLDNNEALTSIHATEKETLLSAIGGLLLPFRSPYLIAGYLVIIALTIATILLQQKKHIKRFFATTR
jgi:uncharacterized repeat protein (TIGR01451 family)